MPWTWPSAPRRVVLRSSGGRPADGGDCCTADPQSGVAPGLTRSRNVRSRYRCSMCPAIHINSRSWLRSSSTHEPSDPPPRVVIFGFSCSVSITDRGGEVVRARRTGHELDAPVRDGKERCVRGDSASHGPRDARPCDGGPATVAETTFFEPIADTLPLDGGRERAPPVTPEDLATRGRPRKGSGQVPHGK